MGWALALRPPSFTALANFLGLACAFAGASLIAALIVFELSFDRGIDPDAQVYRLDGLLSVAGQTPRPVSGVDPKLGPAIRAARPDWKVARLAGAERVRVEIAGRGSEEQPFFADADLAEVFRIPRVRGDPGATLARPDGVVLSEEAASRLCGQRDCLGSVIRIGEIEGRVGAIVRWPGNSSLRRHQVLISGRNPASPLARADASIVTGAFGISGISARFTFVIQAIVYVRAAGHAPQIIQELNTVAGAAAGVDAGAAALLVTRPDAHTLDEATRAAAAAGDPDLERLDPQALAALSIAAMATLLVASLSYVSLAAAQAISRGREIGIRKAFGATGAGLALGVVARSIASALLAGLAGLLLGHGLLGWFSALTGRALHFPVSAGGAGLALGVAVGVGILAGIAPALLLALPKPAALLNGREGKAPGSGPLRAILVALQLAVAAIAGAFSLSLAAQLRHDTSLERLHFDAREVGVARVRGRDFPMLQPTRAQDLVEAALAQPGVLSAASANVAPTFNQPLLVTMRRAGEGQEAELGSVNVSPGFFQTLRMAPLAGRVFQEEDVRSIFTLQGENRIVLSQTAALRLGFTRPEAAIGAALQWGSPAQAAIVIGVVEDAPMGEVRLREPAANVFFCGRDLHQFLVLRTALGVSPEQALRTSLREESLFTINSIENLAARVRFQFRELFRVVAIVSVLTVMNMIAAAIGLVALALSMLQRMRLEAGVRKTFGAGSGDLIALFARRLALPVALGLAGGLLASFWASRAYLSQFPEPAHFSWAANAWVALSVLCAFGMVIGAFGLRLAQLRPSAALRVT